MPGEHRTDNGDPTRTNDAVRQHLSVLRAGASRPLTAGYHRQRVGLKHPAFHGKSRAHVDEIAAWVKASGTTSLYESEYPYAGGPGYYALYGEDPDRIKVEVVASGGA